MGPKKQDFRSRINCSQMKLPNFVNPFTDSPSKIGHDFECVPKQVIFNEKKSKRFE